MIDEILYNLQFKNYWDCQLLGNKFSRLQLRQEWDLETNHKIRDAIINALKNQRIIQDKQNSNLLAEIKMLLEGKDLTDYKDNYRVHNALVSLLGES